MRDVRVLELAPKRVLYEDADLLAVDKPPGIVAHPTVDPDRGHLVAAVERFLLQRDGAVGHLRLLHRLDVQTSGVVLLSRSPEVDRALGDAFAQRRVEKTYWAIVRAGEVDFPTIETTLHGYLAAGKGPGGRTLAVKAGGKPATTRVKGIEGVAGSWWVQARPQTGRTHQIRVQLADFGFPILGDALYGGADPGVKRLLLHARAVELVHPRTGATLRVRAPAPRAFTTRYPASGDERNDR